MMTNFHVKTTVVAIFPNVCLWRRSLCSDLVLTLKNRIEPPSYARTAYVVAIWPSFLFDSFVKIWATCECFWANGLPPPLAKNFPYAYGDIISLYILADVTEGSLYRFLQLHSWFQKRNLRRKRKALRVHKHLFLLKAE